MEYRVRGDMPEGAVIHHRLVDGQVVVDLNPMHEEWWADALTRAGLEVPRVFPACQDSRARSAS